MKKILISTAVLATLAAPAAASTFLDFTSGGIGTGNTSGSVFGVTYTISAGNAGGAATLTDATHKNNVGCTGAGWEFACDAVGNRFDVGFGVEGGGNDNEIDGINNGEFVQVAFTSLVQILGFAGMLTYNDSLPTGGTENVVLQYSSDNGATFTSIVANALNLDSDPGGPNDSFGTVGLAFRDNISVIANVVRFRAGGTSPFDDGNANITAAALKIAPVPVPAALPLLLVGMGALGFAARRKRRSTA